MTDLKDITEEHADHGENDEKPTTMVVSVAKTVKTAVTNKLDPVVEIYAQMFSKGLRVPILRRPSDYGMAYEDVFFPSMDGITLEGWFIPAEGSNKLLIINHPMTCNRYGFPGHLAPWNTMTGGFEVNFLPELKLLHDAGYNILTYDLRNCGRSGNLEASGAADVEELMRLATGRSV